LFASMAAPPDGAADDAVAPFRGQVDLVVDGGRCAGGAPSTVVEIGPAGLRVLRPGAVDIGASP
ncbi:MAG: Sua5/YciO/YrdC/YwlC family protein, partial [Acidobacteriota bacterium]